MSDTELQVLERDVEAARARFAGDLDRLRSPSVVSGFQDDLMADARSATDQVVAKAKDAVSDGVRHVVADLKERAAANPVAAVAIGAGLAWRLARHPPIASLLVGVGLWSLWRTGPFGQNGGFGPQSTEVAGAVRERATELAGIVRERAQEWSVEAREALTDVSGKAASTLSDAAASAQDTIKDTVQRLKDKVVSGASSAADNAPKTIAQLRDQAAAAGQKASGALREIASDDDTRDSVLLGAAAVAVAAAVGLAYQRRSADEAE